jgi:polyhydroxyalkanoate synthase
MVPGQSFIEFLLKRGYDVYMLDWNAPKPEEKSLRMEDYVLDFIPDAVRRVQEDSGVENVTVIGYCFGGVLSLLYGSIFHDGPMKNLICFTTPVDFRQMKLFANFADRRYFDVDHLVDSVGNMPPELILQSFEMLRPASRTVSQVQLWENIWNDEYVKSFRMFDRWATDILPLAGEYFRAIIKDLMWDNKLFNDTMTVGGRPARLDKITRPPLGPRVRQLLPTTQRKFTGSPVRRRRWLCISNRNEQPARATFRRTPPMSAYPLISTRL